MQVDIYIREVGGNHEIRIPWLPDEISYGTGEASTATYDIMKKGEVIVPTGVGLATCTWESIFPGKQRTDTSMLRGKWIPPATYCSTLNRWKKEGTRLNLMVVGYPINLTAYLTNFTYTASGGFGDISYSLAFKEAKIITVSSKFVHKVQTTTTTSKTTTRPKTTPQTYVVKSGDTLWSIAEKTLGSGAKWTTLYNLNKTSIDSIAWERWKAAGIKRGSENGKWIFPGTKICITN